MHLTDLTSRQRQIAEGIFAGKQLIKIGEELSLSPKTVSSHKAVIYKKVGVKTDADFIKFMVKEIQDGM